MKIKLKHWQVIAVGLMIYDAIVIVISWFAGLWLRFDCRYSMIPPNYMEAYLHFIPCYVLICLVVFLLCGIYRSMWRFASFMELICIGFASLVTCLLHALLITIIFGRMPLVYYFVGAVSQFFLTLAIRFSYRFVLLVRSKGIVGTSAEPKTRVMLVGAGVAGQGILRNIVDDKNLGEKVVCFIDDNANKWGRSIDGVPIVGGKNDILVNVEKYKVDKIYITIPSASVQDRREIINICKESDCELKVLPGTSQLVTGKVTMSDLKTVSIEDLLGRETIKVDMQEIFKFISGKVILVTGGGGSIGAELCRQIAKHSPKQLIIFDVYENNAYDIEQELRRKCPRLNLVTLIGSVRDSRRLDQVFNEYKPEIVYHAAAHKHVPLMETSPQEAIKNNTIGTYKTAYAAMMHGCKRFVLISTDKAVNPTNIMGASKRLCEMVVQSFDAKIKEGKALELPNIHFHYDEDDQQDSGFVGNRGNGLDAEGNAPKTEFVCVRFGNVLGSNGSVIPLFKKQIAEGGPVTVTHPDIIRYFMTIPEAVSLVLQAGTYAKGGEIFVLDMGEPMKIDTLARNLIRLSGLRPDEDIRIEYTGLRPGEKMFEEKLMEEEGLKTTPNNLIHIGAPIPFDTDTFLAHLGDLMDAAYRGDDGIREMVEEMTGTYHPGG
mgnify:CR=1 FL=1